MSAVLSDDPVRLITDSVTNRLIKFSDNKSLQENEDAFYVANAQRFYITFDKHQLLIKNVILPTKEVVDDTQKIKEKELMMLTEIKKIFRSHKSNYKIVLHPLLDEVKFSVKDKETMETLFGNHVYDFTGNNSYTGSYKDYYDMESYKTF